MFPKDENMVVGTPHFGRAGFQALEDGSAAQVLADIPSKAASTAADCDCGGFPQSSDGVRSLTETFARVPLADLPQNQNLPRCHQLVRCAATKELAIPGGTRAVQVVAPSTDSQMAAPENDNCLHSAEAVKPIVQERKKKNKKTSGKNEDRCIIEKLKKEVAAKDAEIAQIRVIYEKQASQFQDIREESAAAMETIMSRMDELELLKAHFEEMLESTSMQRSPVTLSPRGNSFKELRDESTERASSMLVDSSQPDGCTSCSQLHMQKQNRSATCELQASHSLATSVMPALRGLRVRSQGPRDIPVGSAPSPRTCTTAWTTGLSPRRAEFSPGDSLSSLGGTAPSDIRTTCQVHQRSQIAAQNFMVFSSSLGLSPRGSSIVTASNGSDTPMRLQYSSSRTLSPRERASMCKLTRAPRSCRATVAAPGSRVQQLPISLQGASFHHHLTQSVRAPARQPVSTLQQRTLSSSYML